MPGRKFCPACAADYYAQAVAWQEHDALHRYLHERDDLMPGSRHLQKLRVQAKALGIDWRAEPPEPMTFDARLARVTHREPPRKKAAQPVQGVFVGGVV